MAKAGLSPEAMEGLFPAISGKAHRRKGSRVSGGQKVSEREEACVNSLVVVVLVVKTVVSCGADEWV
jgi:hypothetical protein